MLEVEGNDASSPSAKLQPMLTKGKGLKRMRYYKNHRSKSIVTVDMPVRCPEEDPIGTERRQIRLYVADRRQIWLDLADVEWAARYLYIQKPLKGVPLIVDDSTGPGGAPPIHGDGDNGPEDAGTCGNTH